MKNLKKISRKELKKVQGGKLPIVPDYPDMCHGSEDCAKYGLRCEVYAGSDTNGQWWAYRCV